MNARALPTAAEALRRPVLSAADVAVLLRRKSVAGFHQARTRLEAKGFPKKLPGINGWSRAAVMHWINTNGGTYEPDRHYIGPADDGSVIAITAALDGEYGQ